MAQRFTAEATDELSCPVCLQYYVLSNKPKVFPKCSHICCLLCLKAMATAGASDITCPVCKTTSDLPPSGVDGMTTIRALQKLAEKHPEGILQHREHLQSELCKQKKGKQKMFQEYQDVKQQVVRSIRHEEQEIEMVLEMLMMQVQDLVAKLKEIGSKRLTEVQERIVQIRGEIGNIEDIQFNLETMSDEEFITETDAITNQMSKLNSTKRVHFAGSAVSTLGKFIPKALNIGNVVVPRTLELVQEFGQFGYACGVAVQPDGALLVSDGDNKPQQVVVFDDQDGEYKKQHQFDVKYAEENGILDMAISSTGKILLTKSSAQIDIYSSRGEYQRAIRTHLEDSCVEKEVVTTCVTTTKDGRILAGTAVKIRNDPSMEFVTILDAKGDDIIRMIPIRITPIRITDISGNRVAVTDAYTDKVCVYDLDSGTEILNLDVVGAVGITYDDESRCLLIGRCTKTDEDGEPIDGSGVIEQYCSITGNFVSCLANGLKAPVGMCLFTCGSMLAVADKDTVKIYKIY